MLDTWLDNDHSFTPHLVYILFSYYQRLLWDMLLSLDVPGHFMAQFFVVKLLCDSLGWG